MTQTANNYGTVLFELGITKEIVEKTKEIFELTSELPRVLNCPVVSRKEKHRMIEKRDTPCKNAMCRGAG